MPSIWAWPLERQRTAASSLQQLHIASVTMGLSTAQGNMMNLVSCFFCHFVVCTLSQVVNRQGLKIALSSSEYSGCMGNPASSNEGASRFTMNLPVGVLVKNASTNVSWLHDKRVSFWSPHVMRNWGSIPHSPLSFFLFSAYHGPRPIHIGLLTKALLLDPKDKKNE